MRLSSTAFSWTTFSRSNVKDVILHVIHCLLANSSSDGDDPIIQRSHYLLVMHVYTENTDFPSDPTVYYLLFTIYRWLQSYTLPLLAGPAVTFLICTGSKATPSGQFVLLIAGNKDKSEFGKFV